MTVDSFTLRPIGRLRSSLERIEEAPRQGLEGAPDAQLEIDPAFATALRGLSPGDAVVVITWLHLADRDVLETHPRNDLRNPLTGVFATRSPDRPNPLGLHRVIVRAIDGLRLHVGPIEAVDGTPVADLKPVLDDSNDG
jgi:tRNA-Thr(GGU) m(6)t(6)A37 methyltransferase TsaA